MSEPMSSLVPGGGTVLTPAGGQATRSILTARSTFVPAGTRYYAAEVIIDNGGFVTEQSVITGTDRNGLLRNASGSFAILGNNIGEIAQMRGQICTP